MTEFDDTLRVCAVCSRVLSHAPEHDTWEHPIPDQADHPAVPALPSEIHTERHCDFCFALNPVPAWHLPVRDFMYPVTTWTPGTEELSRFDSSRGDWGVCKDCKTLIDADLWGKLLRRYKAAWERDNGVPPPPLAVDLVWLCWSLMRDNILGPMYPSNFPEPPA